MDSRLLAVCLVPVTLLIYLLINRSITDQRDADTAKRMGCHPPKTLHHRVPWGLDLVYELFRADRNKVLPECLRERFARAGAGTYRYEFLNRTTIFTIDPENLQAILSSQFQDFSLGTLRRANFLPFLGHGIFTEDGEDWERSRSMLRPHFLRSQISDLSLEEVYVQRMIEALRLNGSGWTAQVDLQPFFFRLTLDSATEFLLGKSVNSQSASLDKDAAEPSNENVSGEVRFGKAFDTCSKWLAIRARMNELYWLLDGNEFRASCKETHQYVDNLVDVAIAEGSENKANRTKKTFLDSLLEQTSDRVKVRSELINMLLAGRDTTAGLLGWLFHVLVRHPETYLKLRNLILEDFGPYDHPREITFARLKDCQYLQYCLNETLRLYPPVPANSRQAIKDTTIPRGGGPDGMGKVFVGKDQQVNYTVYALHRRKDLWGSDADEFKPERWIGRKSGWDYLPFNGGPRHCLGRKSHVSFTIFRVAISDLS